jgi:hypothetical protein
MDIWDTNKLIIFIAFVIPGFISLKVYELLCPGPPKDSSSQIVDAIAYSCINYALLFWPIQLVETSELRTNSPNLYALFYLFVLFVAPIVWVTGWKLLRTRQIFQKIAPHPTQKPWDFVFSKRKPYWIKVILKDGKIIAGKYAANSFASSAPAEEQIYLEETWILNDKLGFERPKKRSAGVIIMASDISYVELAKYHEE